jgi:uncharacterized protein YchJ
MTSLTICLCGTVLESTLMCYGSSLLLKSVLAPTPEQIMSNQYPNYRHKRTNKLRAVYERAINDILNVAEFLGA